MFKKVLLCSNFKMSEELTLATATEVAPNALGALLDGAINQDNFLQPQNGGDFGPPELLSLDDLAYDDDDEDNMPLSSLLDDRPPSDEDVESIHSSVGSDVEEIGADEPAAVIQVKRALATSSSTCSSSDQSIVH